MKSIIYETDKQGYIKNSFHTYLDMDGNITDENLKNCISIPPPHGLFRAKWTGSEWVEGETEEEKVNRESQQLLESLKPSPTEVADAELEIKLIKLLMELEVKQ